MAKAKSDTKGKTKSKKIREDLAVVRITARTGRLPIVSDDVEWINPTTKRVVPGIVLEFGNEGVCELDPQHDADTIKAVREWLNDGRDPRIAEQGVFEVAADALLPPFPNWDTTEDSKVVEMADTLGYDPEMCLRYELGRGDKARPKVVKALEARVDAEPEIDADAEPQL